MPFLPSFRAIRVFRGQQVLVGPALFLAFVVNGESWLFAVAHEHGEVDVIVVFHFRDCLVLARFSVHTWALPRHRQRLLFLSLIHI